MSGINFEDVMDIIQTTLGRDVDRCEMKLLTVVSMIDEWPDVPQPMTAEDVEKEFDIKLYEDEPVITTRQTMMDKIPSQRKTYWPEHVSLDTLQIERYQQLEWDIVEWGNTGNYCIICPVEYSGCGPKSNFFLWKDGTIHVNSTGLAEYESEHNIDIHSRDKRQFPLAKGYFKTRYEAGMFLNGYLVSKTLDIDRKEDFDD